MKDATITLSTKGHLTMPKKIREADALTAGTVFRLKRSGPGKYLLEKLTPQPLRKARLVRDKDGLLVFRVPPGSPKITSEMIKKLEAETI